MRIVVLRNVLTQIYKERAHLQNSYKTEGQKINEVERSVKIV